MNALAGILPNRPESYVIYKGDEVEDETITFRTVANDLRKVVENILMQDLPALQTVWPTEADLQNSPTGPANSPGNQFGLTFLTRTYTIVPQDLKIVLEISLDRPLLKLNMLMQDLPALQTVWICTEREDGFHSTQRCLYLFRDSTPRSWKPGKQIQRIVDIRHAARFDTDRRMGEGEGWW